MAKFLLADPSIKDVGGHYFEYAARVLKAAREQGHDPVLGSNRAFDPKEPVDFPVHRVFRLSFFENADPEPPNSAAERRKAAEAAKALRSARRFTRREMSQRGLDRARAEEMTSFRDPAFGAIASEWAHFRSNVRRVQIFLAFRYLRGARERFDRALSARIERRPRLHRVARAFGRTAEITGKLARVGFRISLMALAAPLVAIRERIRSSNKTRMFETDLAAFLRRSGASANDTVFVPTLGDVELAGLVSLCRRSKVARSIKWRLLFRRNLFVGDGPDRIAESEQHNMRRLRSLLSFARSSIGSLNIRLLTDTDPLTEQYLSLGIFGFETAPIPVDDRLEGVAPQERSPGPLIFTYLGDARTEKGYHHLPDMLDAFAHDVGERSRVRLVAQSNFNTPRGEPAAVKARLSLMLCPREEVELVYGPLETAEYVDLIRRSHVLLAPYSSENYAARSSGVFAEALRAGLPTITSGGTWMAGLIEPYRQPRLEAVFRQHEGGFRRFYDADRVDGDRMFGNLVHMPVGTANALAVSLECAPHPLKSLRLEIECIDEHGRSFTRLREHVSLIQERVRSLVALPLGTRWIHLSAALPGAAASIVPERISLSLANLPPSVPYGFGGVICDSNPFALARAMQNIDANYQTYLADARILKRDLGDMHTPANLVRVVASDPSAPSDADSPPAARAVRSPSRATDNQGVLPTAARTTTSTRAPA
jgi:glycosyltransferase involved in cell wall biosynthesis